MVGVRCMDEGGGGAFNDGLNFMIGIRYPFALDVVHALTLPPLRYPCTGEYFLSEEQKRARATAAQEAKQAKKVEERAKQRQAAFVAPKVRVDFMGSIHGRGEEKTSCVDCRRGGGAFFRIFQFSIYSHAAMHAPLGN